MTRATAYRSDIMLFTVDNMTLKPASRGAESWLAGRAGTVDIEPVSKTRRRSLEQNAKYRAWCAQIDADTCNEPGWAHGYNKYHVGFAILLQRKPERRQTIIEAIGNRQGDALYLMLSWLVPCTSEYTAAEMTMFMDAVQRHWAQEGVVLE